MTSAVYEVVVFRNGVAVFRGAPSGYPQDGDRLDLETHGGRSVLTAHITAPQIPALLTTDP